MKLMNSKVGQSLSKPQNQFSSLVREKAICQVRDWLKEFDMSGYHARLLADKLVQMIISEQIKRTSASAPDVYLADNAKIESLVMQAKRLADKLDKEEKLESLLVSLCQQDSYREGNS